MKKLILSVIIELVFSLQIVSQIKVHPAGHYLQTKDGKPFFWLGDTDWELFHRLTREDADHLIRKRAQQGFNVLQAVALAEFEGIRTPNRYGDYPLIDQDPGRLDTTPGKNPSNAKEYDYWDHVDYVIQLAARYKMYIGLLPTWGDKVAHYHWGDGPIIFNEVNAYRYAKTLATRYKNQWNVLWILGGDRPSIYKDKEGKDYDDRPIWTAMANAIESVIGNNAFITYHPSGGKETSTSYYLHDYAWMDMNTFQSSHGSKTPDTWNWTDHDWNMKPAKPTIDMEPCYEDHPVNPWDGKWTRKERGYFNAYDVRARIYRGVFAGQCGVTYGHHQIWQFTDTSLYKTVNVGDTIIPWKKALVADGAKQMIYLKKLMLSRPFFHRIHDNSIIKSEVGETFINRSEATRAEDGSYAMIYIPDATEFTIDLNKITGTLKAAWYYNVTTGKAQKIKLEKHSGIVKILPLPGTKDWVLVLDDASKNYRVPGT